MTEKDIARLQRAQNCIARVVSEVSRYSRSVPILKRLHWLPAGSLAFALKYAQ